MYMRRQPNFQFGSAEAPSFEEAIRRNAAFSGPFLNRLGVDTAEQHGRACAIEQWFVPGHCVGRKEFLFDICSKVRT